MVGSANAPSLCVTFLPGKVKRGIAAAQGLRRQRRNLLPLLKYGIF